jgi:hypothetical protein
VLSHGSNFVGQGRGYIGRCCIVSPSFDYPCCHELLSQAQGTEVNLTDVNKQVGTQEQ